MKSPLLLALASAAVVAVPVAQARITEVKITSRTPAFLYDDDGNPATPTKPYSWPGVGTYERIVGVAKGEVDPTDRRNSVIVDIELAPRNARGNVEYSFNFYILKPAHGNGRVMYEPPNRGGKTWQGLGRVTTGGNDPGSISDPAELAKSFLMPRGYTLVWSGWEELGDPNATLTATAVYPIAKNRNGSTITGPAYEYIVSSARGFTLAYPAFNYADKTSARLTHRVHLNDVPADVPAANWTYYPTGIPASGTLPAIPGPAIGLINPATGAPVNFVNNDIYEFMYTAKDPSPKGLGFAAVRDWNSWLRNAAEDDLGNANPLAGTIEKIYTEVVSQPGRLLNDFRNLGFNEDENGRKVFDGHMQWIAAGDGINMNYRFSQSGRTERNRQHHLYLEGRFPFANVNSHDPITRQTDSRYGRCEQTNTCPLGVEIYSANEYWVKAASLLHTDPSGSRDLPDSQYTRNYFISSHMHGSAGFPLPAGPSAGSCQQPQNPLNSAPVQRALFIALDDWATTNRKPPDSRVPTLKDGTLVPPLPQSGMGFPNIPGVTYTGLKTTRYRFDYGLDFYETGIATINPPVITPPYEDNPANGPIYPSYVPKTDSDGNDIAGVRLPDVTVPLATYTGWALRSGVWANDGCESSGQMIKFAPNAAARGADPRPSVAERYASFEDYYGKAVQAIDDLVAQRLYLCEDAQPELDRLVSRAAFFGLPAPAKPVPAAATFPHCQMERAGRSDHFKN